MPEMTDELVSEVEKAMDEFVEKGDDQDEHEKEILKANCGGGIEYIQMGYHIYHITPWCYFD